MKTISQEEFKKLYGTKGIESFSQTKEPQKNFLERTKESFTQGFSRMGQAVEESKQGKNPISTGAKFASGAIESLTSPLSAALSPVIKPTLGRAMDASSEKLSNLYGENIQRGLYEGGKTKAEEVLETTRDITDIAGLVTGGRGVSKVAGTTARGVSTGVQNVVSKTGKVGNYAKNVAKDVVPNSSRIIEHQVSRALDLSPADLINIEKSTGNAVGKWIADKNLIGVNKEATQANLGKFYKENYDLVRSEITKVQKVYKQNQVPRFVDALKQIKSKVDGVVGLERVGVEVDNLLNFKKDLTLNDVQRVKELMDDHFSLYKVTGDVAENVSKQGLANLRQEIKAFIEKEVKENTGADIADLNNNVSTARSLNDAITKRSTKGLTRSNIKVGDLGIFGAGMATGGPLFGLALLFGKKLIESPTVRLRMAKYVDGLSDAQKVKIKTELEAGKIPQEFKQFIKKKS